MHILHKKQRNYLIVSIHLENAIICQISCVFITILDNAWDRVYDVDLEKYAQMTKEITDFLNGEDKTILHHLEDRMNKASEQLDFEQAKEYRDMIQHIHNLTKTKDYVFR